MEGNSVKNRIKLPRSKTALFWEKNTNNRWAKSFFVGKIEEQNFPSVNNWQPTLFTHKQLTSSHDSQKLINHVNKMIMRSHTVTPHCPVNRKHRWNDFGISRALQKWNSKWCSSTSLFFFFWSKNSTKRDINLWS